MKCSKIETYKHTSKRNYMRNKLKKSRNQEINEEPSEISKTQKKKQMDELQEFGVQLVKLSKDRLKKLELPEDLSSAIKEAQRLTSHNAISRQCQYIGKLMRNIDVEEIRAKLEYSNGDSAISTQILHMSEYWRDTLLADENEHIQEFITEYGIDDLSELRNVLRVVRKDLEKNAVSKNGNKLFKLIKSQIEKKLLNK